MDHIEAHKYSSKNRDQLTRDTVCGCFYCLEIFHPSEIKIWLQEGSGTALCPYCTIDAIIGESSGYPITKGALEKMHQHWFGM